jgi:hypothetical protein
MMISEPTTNHDLAVLFHAYKVQCRLISLANCFSRWGNLNGVVSSNIYYTKYAPHFYSGHGTVLGYLTVFLFGGSVITHFLLERENKKRMNGERDHWTEGKTPEELEVMGDKK